jgi:hypothetical protein
LTHHMGGDHQVEVRTAAVLEHHDRVVIVFFA